MTLHIYEDSDTQSAAGMEAFPPLPNVRAIVFNKLEIMARWPEFGIINTELAAHRHYADEPIGLIAGRHKLGGTGVDDGYGAALILLLPEKFVSSLTNLTGQLPKFYLRLSLDMLKRQAVLEWSTRLDGQEHAFLVPVNDINRLMQRCRGNAHNTLVWLPIVFVAGNAVACSGMWIDAPEEAELQAMAIVSGENYNPYGMFDKTELAQAQAKCVGSPTPWQNRYWTDGDARKVAQVRILELH